MKPEIKSAETIYPITFSMETITASATHWHDYIEIIYILSGTLTLQINEHSYTLNQEDFFLINRYDRHEYITPQCDALIFNLHLSAFHDPTLLAQSLRFDCNSITAVNADDLIAIRKILAHVIKSSAETTASASFKVSSYAYALLYELSEHFTVIHEASSLGILKTFSDRMLDVLTYLNENYSTQLLQKEVAERFYITPPYFSKAFKETTGKGFKSYLTDLRLSQSIPDLSQSNWSIEFIANRNGFPSARTFSQVFKEKYGLTPHEYQKQLLLPPRSYTVTKTDTPIPTDQMHHNNLASLAQYIENEDLPANPVKTGIKHQLIELDPISYTKKGRPLRHSFKTMTGIGKAKHILFSEHQQMLKTVQKDIGFRYIKFHGLFDDEMMVYSENNKGEPILNFTYIDMVLDFLLSVQLRPFIQFTFMPLPLSRSTSHKLFQDTSVISLPKNMDHWIFLVTGFLLHVEQRYGRTEIETWLFSLWNEPDSPNTMFGFDKREDYFEFYKTTYHAVKSVNQNFTFGAPSVMTTTIEDGTWITEYLDFCRMHHCVPEFLNYHFYPITTDNKLTSNLQSASGVVLRKSEHAMKENIDLVLKNTKSYGWNIDTIYMSEWNFSISYRELLNDTAFKATYVVKNLLENYDRLESFNYWSQADLIEEVTMTDQMFHGGMGLFFYNGIKKPPYYALEFISRLGDVLLDHGDGYFITKKEDSIQIILYNYQHISNLYASGELFDMTFLHRYAPFLAPISKKFTVPLWDLPKENYLITDKILNREFGSVFDQWINMGAFTLNEADDIQYLKSISLPKVQRTKLQTKHGHMTLSRELAPHEVRYVEIKPYVETKLPFDSI